MSTPVFNPQQRLEAEEDLDVGDTKLTEQNCFYEFPYLCIIHIISRQKKPTPLQSHSQGCDMASHSK
jgi:hypothetical protein